MTLADPVNCLQGKHILLGVTGSIAAYKAVSLLRALKARGAFVSVVMTAHATEFVTPLTFEVLSGERVLTDLFHMHEEMKHLHAPENADVMVIAPATANFLAKAALGLADDLLSTMLLAARCPIIVAPAMDGGMWTHPTVVEHVNRLRARGVVVLDPEEGPLASGRIAQGRLVCEEKLLDAVQSALCVHSDWEGEHVLVSAGPTQEAIDPVRFISNRSSGKMGYALAEAARARGASVVLVTGPTALARPSGVEVVSVTSAQEMADAMCQRLEWATVVIMAAAVADFCPKESASQKLKKSDRSSLVLELVPTPDILTILSAQKTKQILVGFAAETEHLLEHASRKLADKGLDAIVANDVTQQGGGFGSDQNAAVVLTRDGRRREIGLMPKRRLADEILTEIKRLKDGGCASTVIAGEEDRGNAQ
ncbi:MAG: bifunctional phosphopantothenoylcysteine decarboxylase/phosphopantothenate--cysteine ligase CoaBC [Nitrospira sp.]|nr:bifunctional phosphopantothenoylcysteine decarboxylase/phosphopantothenate--cysteine ligase CoaBC [Nitrospira sp.]